VRPRVTGKPAPGYDIARVDPNPNEVEIIGPSKEIESVDSAITDPIDVTGVLDQITVVRPAYVSDPLIQVTDPNPVRITITMQKGNPKP
jgi:YbbR domain-containing protein